MRIPLTRGSERLVTHDNPTKRKPTDIQRRQKKKGRKKR